jgi:hypothetical protein
MNANWQAVCSFMQEYFALHPDPQRENKVCVTLAAFYIFHKRAADYAELSAASLPKIQQRLVTLFDTESMLAAPDCPELEGTHDDIRMVLFQKINRYLFEELDSILEQYLNAEMPDVSTVSSLSTLSSKILLPLPSLLTPLSGMSELPVPPIEWTINILEQLDYTIYLNLEFPLSLCEWIKTIVDRYYDSTSLIHYLQLGWNAVLARYSEIMMVPSGTTERAKLIDTFVDRLRNTMCYPARVSVLISSLV